MGRPIRARIHLDALAQNLAVARRHAPHTRMLAVIKANAYGHGLLPVAAALREADGYGLLDLEEAIQLRHAGFSHPIVMLEGLFGPEELPAYVHHHLTAVIHHPEQLDMLARLRSAAKLDVFLKLNTGMNRLGFSPEEFPATLSRLKALPHVGRITLMSHFATADEAEGIDWQLQCFERVTAGLEQPCSLANSAAILRFPAAHRDWARPGIMLYGASPLPECSAAELGLRPAMTLESRVIAVQSLAAGDRVGYGGLFRAEASIRVGIVGCGYADGYPRHAPTGTPVLVAGVRTRTLGRVSMDMLCVDLSGIPDAGAGDPVVLWGEGMPVEEVAHAAGTVSYELLCAVAPRVPREES